MQLLPADEHHLRRALTLAEAAAAFASPNPAVGCVITQGDQPGAVLGEGAHSYDLRDHAEIAALKDAAQRGYSVRGATAYVTLEPCSHHGRTGPCADALIAAGIARCVVATVDPNPLVRGKGLAKLLAAGVAVEVAEPESAVAQAARRLNDAFAFSIQHNRPFVTLKAAVSSDGGLAPSADMRSAREPHWITGPAARGDVQKLRHRSDALICGIGTVLADNPGLTDRTGLPRRRPLLRVVLDRRLRTPLDSKLVRESQGNLLLLAAEGASEERADLLRQAGAEVIFLPVNEDGISLQDALDALMVRDILSVLLEAGSALNGSFLRQNLVDRVVLYTGPAPLGDSAVPFADGGPDPRELLVRLSSASEQRFAHDAHEDVRVTGYLHDPWAGV